MNTMRRIAALLCLVLAVCCLAGCSNNGKLKVKADEAARQLAKAARTNHSELFPSIDGVSELAAPICIVVAQEWGETGFYSDKALPVARPEDAKALLLVEMNGGHNEEYSCDLTYATPDGGTSIKIGSDIDVTPEKPLLQMLQSRFTFVEGEATLFGQIEDYQATLRSRDYLSAVNACADDYENARELTAEDIAEPMVYMVDANFVCEPVEGNDLFARPAEDGQYVPPEDEPYQRPEISGDISLGISRVLKQGSLLSTTGGGHTYTMAEVQAMFDAPPERFCFSEVVGRSWFGEFAGEGGQSFTAYTYDMRVSAITLDGQLLGATTVRCAQGDMDTHGIAGQLIGNTLSVDKNGTVVLPWSYTSKLVGDRF